MTTQKIFGNRRNIISAARAFRKDANDLMESLALRNNFSLAAGEGFPPTVYCHKRNNIGFLNDEWQYYFHGAECRFENMCTGQVVELIYTTKPEFGFLDGYFFFNYMCTTEKHKSLGRWFQNDGNVYKAINLLADKGLLTRVHMDHTTRIILAE